MSEMLITPSPANAAGSIAALVWLSAVLVFGITAEVKMGHTTWKQVFSFLNPQACFEMLFRIALCLIGVVWYFVWRAFLVYFATQALLTIFVPA